MKRMKKAITIVIATATMASQAMTAMAAEWKQNEIGYWYQEDNGSYPTNSWKWINGRCYYFDSNGYMLANTTTPDGYTVDATGAWTVNGAVQTRVQDRHQELFIIIKIMIQHIRLQEKLMNGV